jgi:rhodanese-related sulfurtransferase
LAVSVACFFLALLIFLSASARAETKSAAPLVTHRRAHELLSGPAPPLLVDVRTKAEFESGHLKNALNIPHDLFVRGAYSKKIGDIPKDKHVLLYCRSGRRSGIAQDVLARDGYSNIKNMKGGIIEWKKAGLPVVQGAGESGSDAGDKRPAQEEESL